MLIKLTNPIHLDKGYTWWVLVLDGRVYASNRNRAKLEYVGRTL